MAKILTRRGAVQIGPGLRLFVSQRTIYNISSCIAFILMFYINKSMSAAPSEKVSSSMRKTHIQIHTAHVLSLNRAFALY